MFIVAVRFQIHPDHTATFRDAVLINAAASERDEPGCHQFDACFNADGTECFLYEVYDDEAAFGAHRASPHFNTFWETVQPIITDRRFESYERPANPHKA